MKFLTKIAIDFLNKYKTAIADFSNERFNLRTKYKDYSEEAIVKKETEEVPKINKKYSDIIKTIISDVANEIKTKTETLLKKKYTSLNTPQFEAEYSSALIFSSNVPTGYMAVLENALAMKRYGFLWNVIEIILNNDPKPTMFMDMMGLKNVLMNELGLTEIVKEIEELKELAQALDKFDMLNYSDITFNWNSLSMNYKDMINELKPELYNAMYKANYGEQNFRESGFAHRQ